MAPESAAATTVALEVGVVILTAGLTWVGSRWLETGAEELSEHYRLPAVIQGSVVVAIGSSFPELASVVAAGLLGAFDLGVGGVVGSAIFNVLVIPGLAGLATDGNLDSSRTLVYKEAQFYMIAVSALVITFALAVIYYPTEGGAALGGSLTRPLAAIPLAMYLLYLFVQYQDVSDHRAASDASEGAVLPAWGRLLAGLVVIGASVHFLVEAIDALTRTFGVPEFLAGVTVLAAATSLPDALVSVRAARDERGVTSLGNVLGSNTFDLLVAIPLGVLVVGTVPVDFAVAAPMMGVLTVATIMLFTILRTDLAMSPLEAVALLGTYAVFVAWVVAETVGLTSVVRGG